MKKNVPETSACEQLGLLPLEKYSLNEDCEVLKKTIKSSAVPTETNPKTGKNKREKPPVTPSIEYQSSLFDLYSDFKISNKSQELFSEKYLSYLEQTHALLEKKRASQREEQLSKLDKRQYEFYRYLLGQYGISTAQNYVDLVSQDSYLKRNPVLRDSMDLQQEQEELEEDLSFDNEIEWDSED